MNLRIIFLTIFFGHFISFGSERIVGGEDAATCGWPTVALIDGCSATLVHPKAISTAQHCGTPSSVSFGEQGGQHSINVVRCVGQGSDDAQICELAEEVTSLPVTPILFGCELDNFMKPDQTVVIAGFGWTASTGVGFGTKRWAEQKINRVEAGRTVIGDPGDPKSPCKGDSGGPVFVQVGDGSWRVFGTLLSGTTGIMCNSAADYQRVDLVVPHFERVTGIDVTPCFNGETGAWEPTENCKGFFSGDETGSGDWNNWCSGTPASEYSMTCGDPFDYKANLKKEISNNNFRIDFNEFKTIGLTINYTGSYKITLRTIEGKTIEKFNPGLLHPGSYEIKLDNILTNGMYIIQMYSNDKLVIQKRFSSSL